MRNTAVVLWILTSVFAFAQPAPVRRVASQSANAMNAEAAVREAARMFGEQKKSIDRDLQTLASLRAASVALTDPMQPSVSLEKALDATSKAESLTTSFVVKQGIIRARQAMENANRSPGSADFERLRAILQSEAIAPATRVATAHGLQLHEQMTEWLAVQELINAHLRQVADTTAEALRAAQ